MSRSGHPNLRHAVPVVALVALLGAACGSLPTPTSRAAPQFTAVVSPTTGPTTPPVTSAAAKPSGTAKPLFVEFYTTWCAPCKQMDPIIAKLQDEYGSRVDFKILDAAGAAPEKAKYKYVTQPQMVFVDRTGEIFDTLYGLQGYDGLKQRLDQLLSKP